MTLSIDPQVAAVIAAAESKGRTPFERQTVAEARAAYRAGCAITGPLPTTMAEVRDIELAGLRCRLYRPTSPGAPPALLYLHGGGWVVGDLDTHDGVCRRLAADIGCAVLAVDYRLAPEHAFPVPFDDALAAWRAFNESAVSLNLDPGRLGIAGDSAGAALAASVAQASREEPATPRCQLLFYPVADLAAESASYAEITGGVFLTASTMRWFTAHYVPDEAGRSDWRASPLRATDLSAVAPAFVLTVGHDPLRDEGRAYADRLAQAGNQVVHLHLANQIHGLLTQARLMPASETAWACAAAFARQQLDAEA